MRSDFRLRAAATPFNMPSVRNWPDRLTCGTNHGAIAEQLREKLKARGEARVRVEGLNACDWVLIDTGDVIVHVFRPEVREFYNLEKMWQAEIPPDAARGDSSQH
jgi:hypothetical protein